jgi:hypothetical protein
MLRVALGGVLALLLAVPSATAEQGPPSPWDGAIPFDCVLQDAGMGATVKDPDADPFCIEFDKTHQNVTELGVVGFLSVEPARVSAAVDKCFYFQSDHWRGSVVQDDGSTKTYEWDGHYYFDKAKAEGGVWVTNFNVNGQTQDPSQLPGFPAEYAPYFGPGTGGVITHDEVDADPSCIAKAQKASPYAKPAPGEEPARCPAAAGAVGARRLGAVTLGMRERKVWDALGTPLRVKRGFLRFCLDGGTKLMVGVPGDRSGMEGGPGTGRAMFLLTTSPALAFRGVARGAPRRVLRDAFPRAREWFVIGHTHVLRLRPGVIAGVKDGRVRLLAVFDAERVRRAGAARDWLRRSN